jgi:type VI protein secretion system component Hcp
MENTQKGGEDAVSINCPASSREKLHLEEIAMPIYMKIEGVKGSKPDHSDWIELMSAQLGALRRPSNGQGVNRPQSPTRNEIIVSKFVDDTSSALFKESLYGKGRKVTIDFVEKDGKTYMSIELENALISGYSIQPTGQREETKPMETLTFNADSISFKTFARPEDAKDEKKLSEWNLGVTQSQAF